MTFFSLRRRSNNKPAHAGVFPINRDPMKGRGRASGGGGKTGKASGVSRLWSEIVNKNPDSTGDIKHLGARGRWP